MVGWEEADDEDTVVGLLVTFAAGTAGVEVDGLTTLSLTALELLNVLDLLVLLPFVETGRVDKVDSRGRLRLTEL